MKSFLFTLLVLSNLALASEKAQVIILKGKVTKLEPGDHVAKVVRRGDWLIEDTSLVTHDKSFVKLRFTDRSTMNVGPKSMVVINKMPEDKANMVNLLQGMIKAEVKKHAPTKKSKTKMLVRTRSAVMGVRGTKFQTMYNHANKRTSLVTVEGSVAMARNIKKDDSKTPESKSESQAENVEELDKIFEEGSDDIVEVSEGKYSGVAESIEQPTEPVKIAPQQYNAIAKSMDSKKTAIEVMKMNKGEVVAAGKIDKATGKITPKAGGIIDFSTGLYVAPETTAVLDKKTGTFTAKKIGDVNPKTGDYIPPKGIKIDAKKGFVIDQKEIAKIATTEEKQNVAKTLQEMNQGVVKRQVTPVKKNKNVAKKKEVKSSWGPKNHIVSFRVMPYSDQLRVEDKKTGKVQHFISQKADWTNLNWTQVWSDKWSSRLRVGGHSYELDDKNHKLYDYGDNGGDDGEFFSLGVSYQKNERLKFLFDFVSMDQAYVVRANDPNMGGGSSDGVQVIRQEIQSLDLGVEYNTLKWLNLDTSLRAKLHVVIDGKAPSEFGYPTRSSEFIGADFEAYGFYSITKKFGIGTSLNYQRMDVTNSDFKFTRNSYGLAFDFVYDI